MRNSKLVAVALLLIVNGCTSGTTQKMNDEAIFIGGTVAAGPTVTAQKNVAIYVSDGIIREIGTPDGLRTAHPGTRVVDASGGTILPGLIDAHAHLYGLGLALDVVNLTNAATYDEIVARAKERAATAVAGEWILGRGWDQNRWPVKEFPTAAALDAAIPDHPVWLKRVDGHAGLANSAAMRAAGITAETADPPGGRLIRDAAGNPTGVFIDDAMDLVEAKVPPPSFELRKKRVRQAAETIAREGLVGIHDAGADDDTIRAVRELIDEGKFPIRVYTMLTDSAPLLDKYLAGAPIIDHGGRLTVRSIKLYADGALGSRGAALLEPYSDEPSNRGLMLATPEHVREVATRARARGFQVNTHAIGDRGVDNVLDAYEQAGVSGADRFRIEHYQVVAPGDFRRTVQMGVIASMQPTHATSDMPWAEKRVGPDRILGAYAWRTVLNAGGRLALGSDFPVEAVSPFFGIYSATTRQDEKGDPPGGWTPDQLLTLDEAVRGFTIDAAYAAFQEASRGTIEVGKLADFTIVDGDFYSMTPQARRTPRVRATVVGGKIVAGAEQQ